MSRPGVNGAPQTVYARCLQCKRKAPVHRSLGVREVERCDQCRKAQTAVPATYPDEMPGAH